MPITTTSEGIRAVSKVILYPKSQIIPRLHTTPVITTARDKMVVPMLRKKISRINMLNNIEPIKKSFISACILSATRVPVSYTHLDVYKRQSLICKKDHAAFPFEDSPRERIMSVSTWPYINPPYRDITSSRYRAWLPDDSQAWAFSWLLYVWFEARTRR